jgi:hypothetical protein
MRSILMTIIFIAIATQASAQGLWPAGLGRIHPSDIVNINSSQFPNFGGNITLPPNSSFEIYTVPGDKYFVMTSFGASSSSNIYQIRYRPQDSENEIIKLGIYFNAKNSYEEMGVGVAFPPSSIVIIHNPLPSPQNYQFNMSGYHIKPNSKSVWPPPAENLVTISSSADPNANNLGHIQYSANQLEVYYTVPQNKYLIISSLAIDGQSILVQKNGAIVDTKVSEGLGQILNNKNGTGVVFAPGSEVAIQRSYAGIGHFDLVGYLADL